MFYSGQGSRNVAPEKCLPKHDRSIMLTYSDFYNKKSSEAIRRFERNIRTKRASIFMDCGATTLYNKYVKKSTKGALCTYFKDKRDIDFSFYHTQKFNDIRDAYIKFVKKNDEHLFAYVNMDIINHAEGSYDSLKYMESRGCKPVPVYHLTDKSDDK